MTPEEEIIALRKEVSALKAAVLDWKEAWFHQRDIIGTLGFDHKEMVLLLCALLSECDVIHWKKQSREYLIAYLQGKVSKYYLIKVFGSERTY